MWVPKCSRGLQTRLLALPSSSNHSWSSNCLTQYGLRDETERSGHCEDRCADEHPKPAPQRFVVLIPRTQLREHQLPQDTLDVAGLQTVSRSERKWFGRVVELLREERVERRGSADENEKQCGPKDVKSGRPDSTCR